MSATDRNSLAIRRPAAVVGAGVVALVVCSLFAFQRWGGPGAGAGGRTPVVLTAQASHRSLLTSGADRPAAADAPGPAVAPTPAAGTDPVDRLWSEGSLRGTVLDGDWGRWSNGLLQPSFGLRQRFDQLLSAQGEVGLAQLRRWIGARVAADLRNPAAAPQVLDIWDRYLKVQTAAYALEANPNDASTWQPALAEHSRVRREGLGSAWAEAFYGAEERDLAADAARALSSPSNPDRPSTRQAAAAAPDALLTGADGGSAAGIDPARLQAARTARFGAQAADRLQANDAAWAAWQQRLAAGRAAWAAIDADPALSEPQRREAQERLLMDGFDADERPRARGLIVTRPAAADTTLPPPR